MTLLLNPFTYSIIKSIFNESHQLPAPELDAGATEKNLPQFLPLKSLWFQPQSQQFNKQFQYEFNMIPILNKLVNAC